MAVTQSGAVALHAVAATTVPQRLALTTSASVRPEGGMKTLIADDVEERAPE
jgi:hypothetical protein